VPRRAAQVAQPGADGAARAAEGEHRHLAPGRQARVVAAALKKYGALIADNGAPWFIGGAPDDRFDNDDLHTLTRLKGSDFEVVDTSRLRISNDTARVR
jgi:hypothetical protein